MRAVNILGLKLARLRITLSILVSITLTACLCGPVLEPPKPSSQPISATRIAGTNSAFDLVNTKIARTPRADLFRLVNALDTAYGLLDFAPPYPAIRIAGPGHSALDGSTIARAELSEAGDAYIYFDRRKLISRLDLHAVVLHELAHLKAWRMYGPHIAPHGREFQEICKQVTTREKCAAKER